MNRRESIETRRHNIGVVIVGAYRFPVGIVPYVLHPTAWLQLSARTA